MAEAIRDYFEELAYEYGDGYVADLYASVDDTISYLEIVDAFDPAYESDIAFAY